jgi:polysaccharide export outer membrane protein
VRATWLIILWFVLAAVSGCSSPGPTAEDLGEEAAAPATNEPYRLSTGDVISIRVLGEDDLTRDKIRLGDSGALTLPFGYLDARGMTIGELQQAIADGLRGRFLVNPRVSVTIDEYRPFFIQGQVERPGGYPYQPGLNIRKAVSLAGGFKERASTTKIFVVREKDKTNRPARVTVNSAVSPGDTIIVEESFF